MNPEQSTQFSRQDGPARDLATARAEKCLASARERALQRLFEEKVIRLEQRSELHACRRRNFLRTGFLGVVAAGAFGGLGRRMLDGDSWSTASEKGQDPRASTDHSAAPPFAFQAGSFAWDNSLFQLGSHAFAALVWEHDLPIGNATVRRATRVDKDSLRRVLELCEADPGLYARVYRECGGSQPILEELLFRVTPSILVPGQGAEWQIGIPLSLAHAGIHNIVSSDVETKCAVPLSNTTKLSLDYVPLTQFLLGAFCWYTARRYGEFAPILAHIFNNQAGAISLVLGGRRDQRRFEALLAGELSRSNSGADTHIS